MYGHMSKRTAGVVGRQLLDANVIYPSAIRSLLLWLAEEDYIDIRWSDLIEDEVRDTFRKIAMRAAVRDRGPAVAKQYESLVYDRADARSARLLSNMQVAFSAEVSGRSEDARIIMPNDRFYISSHLPDEEDGHVIIAYIISKCQYILTDNKKDFPYEVSLSDSQGVFTGVYKIDVKDPDTFLCQTYGYEVSELIELLKWKLKKDYTKSKQRIELYLDDLSECVPIFAAKLRAAL